MTTSRVADALFARMQLVILDYKIDMQRNAREVRLSPRMYRLWRRCAALLYRADGRETPDSYGPDLFCGIPVRCSEQVACMMAA